MQDVDQASLLDVPPAATAPAAAPPPRPSRRTSKGIAPGDMVLIDRKGRRFHALVEGVEQEGAGQTHNLAIRPLDGRTTYRTATIREVVGVWRKVR
jgi:hypothetical protein